MSPQLKKNWASSYNTTCLNLVINNAVDGKSVTVHSFVNCEPVWSEKKLSDLIGQDFATSSLASLKLKLIADFVTCIAQSKHFCVNLCGK